MPRITKPKLFTLVSGVTTISKDSYEVPAVAYRVFSEQDFVDLQELCFDLKKLAAIPSIVKYNFLPMVFAMVTPAGKRAVGKVIGEKLEDDNSNLTWIWLKGDCSKLFTPIEENFTNGYLHISSPATNWNGWCLYWNAWDSDGMAEYETFSVPATDFNYARRVDF